MSNDLRNSGVVDQFHNDLLVVMLGLSLALKKNDLRAAGHVAAD